MISLEKVYNGYWRTDVENKKLKSKQEEALDRIKKLEESLRKEGTVLGNMIKAMQDPRLAAAERLTVSNKCRPSKNCSKCRMPFGVS